MVVGALRARVEEIAAEIADACCSEVASYASATHQALAAEVLASARAHVASVVGLVERGTPATPEQIEALAVVGHRRFAQGFPLHDVLHAFHIGTLILLGHLADELVRVRKPLRARALMVMVATEAQRSAAAIKHAWLAARAHAEGAPGGDQHTLIDLLLDAEIGDAAGAADQVEAAGVRIAGENVVIVGRLVSSGSDTSTDSPLGALRSIVVRTLGADGLHVVAGQRGDRLVVLHSQGDARADRDLAERLRAAFATPAVEGNGVAGIGSAEPGLAGLRASYHQAARVAELLLRSPSLGSVMTYDEALPLLLLHGDPARARALRRATIDPLLQDRRATALLALVEVAFEASTPAETARRLGIDKTSVLRRARRVEELTGLSPWRHHDSLALHMGFLETRIRPTTHLGILSPVPAVKRTRRIPARSAKR